MNKHKYRVGFVALLVMLLFVMSACQQTEGTDNATQKPAQTTAPTAAQPTSAEETAAPIKNETLIEIRGWCRFEPSADAAGITTYSDQLLWKQVEERLNIRVNWEHCSNAEADAQLGLVMASGNLPDLFGIIKPAQAAQYGVQGAIISLQDLVETECPNLVALMEQDSSVKGQSYAPDGNLYFFPRIMLEKEVMCWPGWDIREDWLEDAGITELPDTIDEVYEALKAMKEADPDRYPLFGSPLPAIWWFGASGRFFNTTSDFFVEDGQLVYGPTDSRYREGLEFLNKLYSEGLLDKDYLTADVTERVLQGVGGMVYGSNAGYLTLFNNLLESDGQNPGFAPIAPPLNDDGERIALGRHNSIDNACGAAISSSSEYATEIARMMDYLYSEEGRLLVYFGNEGDTYTVGSDGSYVYTDEVQTSSLGIMGYLNNYISNISTWPSCIMKEHQLNLYTRPEALEANQIAVETYSDKKLPNLQFTDAELTETQEITRDLNTYIDENIHKFIQGQKSFDEYDEFVTTIEGMGLDRLTELYTTAYERYLDVIS